MSDIQLLLAIAVMSLVNIFTRAFPFLFFTKKELPSSLLFIEKFFPATIMTILIFYSIKDINFLVYPYGLKELFAIVVTVILHLSLKNYLISIFFGTIFYMGLVQFL
ncbi:branched-chain amino acid transporter permease [Halarcobacter anaerophilus]|uniref:branched-chain amino acid transporter permease n=1 Tax=Halarcobacter anaerophilus TaxID=877500 RepID=UPI0005CB3FC1|nr:AzlD domain-containing protein [Halarcobacter anaerophilus]